MIGDLEAPAVRALVLLSGGLDSMLAARVLLEQGVDVIGLTFTSPFFTAERGVRAAAHLGIRHRVVDITDELVEIVREPAHGHGRRMNPCIDCHSLMVRIAASLMREEGARFVATGEVLGERPKSQHLNALGIVEREGGLEGLVLRPLSALLLPDTIPERRGWVDRTRLYSMSGRARAAQFALAQSFKIREFPTPGGGCSLTEVSFTARLRRLWDAHPDADTSSLRLLSYGRHHWDGSSLVIVGRDKDENEAIRGLATDEDAVIRLASDLGPTTLIRWPTPQSVDSGLALTGRYSQERDLKAIAMTIREGGTSRAVAATQHLDWTRQFELIE
jgi:tRNA-uridine 2-sulfurtransferase